MSLKAGTIVTITDTGLVQWGSTATPSIAGQLGMDAVTGRVTGYIGGALVSYAHTADVGGGGVWTLLETITVTGSDVTSVTFSGLNGDTEKIYHLVWRLKVGASAATMQILPNGLTTDMSQISHHVTSSGIHDTSTYTVPSIFDGDVASLCSGEMRIHAVTGLSRHFNGYDIESRAAGGTMLLRQRTTRWVDTGTNITSIVVSATSAQPGVSYRFIYKFI